MKAFSLAALTAFLYGVGEKLNAMIFNYMARHGMIMGLMTLVESSKINSGDVVRSAIIQMFAEESDILRVLPFDNISGNALKYNREAALPGVSFRGVNEAFSESSGVINPMTEALVIAGGDLDVDRFIVTTQGEQVRSTHERMKVKALAAGFTEKFIKGDSTTNPREFDGLQQRLINGQVFSAGSTANGAALSLAVLDEAIDAVDGATNLVMSKAMRRRMTAAARAGVAGNLDWSKDEFGRRIAVYDNLPILVAYDANGGDEILPFNEAAASGTATATSIYVVGFGAGKLQGIQNGDMDVRDLGELQEKPVFRTRVEWYTGICLMQGRAAARIRHIGDLAITA